MVTRRRFLQVGAGAAAVLVIARFGYVRAASGGTAPLGAAARGVLAALVPVILEGALPAAPAERVGQVAATIERIGQSVAALPPHLQSRIGGLFALLAFAPGRWLVAGVRAPWGEASRNEIAAFLERWRNSGWPPLRQGYLALHELVLAAHYADAASWPAIGYPGPPALG